jgi:membrane-anchored mycosin MYCP
MRVPPATKRLTAVLAAGLLVMLAPGTPSAAQPDSADSNSFATPPPLPPDYPTPGDPGQPDIQYNQKTLCVASLNRDVVLANKPWGQNLLRFDELHRFATGKGVSVAVIDTGVNRHEFLGDRLVGGGDYVAKDNGLLDCDGHGTEVAGIIAANPPDNRIGFKGIAPEARIFSIRQSSGSYTGKPAPTPAEPNPQERPAGTLATLAQAIVRAANQVPNGVINMSVDSCRPVAEGPISAAERDVQAALRYAMEVRNVVVVASAGNLNESARCNQQNGPDASRPNTLVIPPWFSEYVISVAAMTHTGDPAEFSVQGPWVTVAAPGTEIISLDPGNSRGLANLTVTKDNKQSKIQGTSFAAPYVSGMAALIRQRFPTLTARQVMNRITVTAAHPAATGGRDNLVGYGMINPIGALTAMIPSEQGNKPDEAISITMEMPPPAVRDWTPVRVALIGSASGVGLLVMTRFIVHTVRRNRRDPEEMTGRDSA